MHLFLSCFDGILTFSWSLLLILVHVAMLFMLGFWIFFCLKIPSCATTATCDVVVDNDSDSEFSLHTLAALNIAE